MFDVPSLVPVELKFYSTYDDVNPPVFATGGSACFDLSAYFDLNKKVRVNKTSVVVDDTKFVTLCPGDIALIPTGLFLDIPKGHSVRLHPRSGLSLFGITLVNCEGVIDSDYVQELMVPLINVGSENFAIGHGQRIAQGELVKNYEYQITRTDAKPEQKSTRIGGFGSTGK